VQIGLQTFNLLLFGLKTCFHFKSSMRQNLFLLLKVLDLELLLEQFCLFGFKILRCTSFFNVKFFLFVFTVLFRLLLLLLDVIDGVDFVLQL